MIMRDYHSNHSDQGYTVFHAVGKNSNTGRAGASIYLGIRKVDSTRRICNKNAYAGPHTAVEIHFF